MADLVGSSGTLVTTTFETLGYHYQAYLLDKLSSPLTESAAALVYVVGAIVVMVGYIMTGKVKDYLWFLLGPALYLGVIVSRTETPGTEWKFGNDPRDQARVTAQVASLILKQQTGFGAEARVSTVFAEYNRVVSRIIQEIVETLDKNRKKTDLRFLLRAELGGFLHAQDIDDAGLRDLLHHGLFRSCAKVLEAGKESQDFHNPPETQDEWRSVYEHQKTNSRVALGDNAVNFIAALKTNYPSLYTLSMQQANAGEQVLAEINGLDRSDKDSETWRREYEDNRRELDANNAFSCQQIWNFSYIGLIQHAKRVVDGSTQTAERNGIDPQKFISDMAQAVGIQKSENARAVVAPEMLYRYVGQTLLRNTWDKTSTSAFLNDYVNRDRIATLRRPAESELSMAERARVGNREWTERSKLMMTAATIPYYQGLGLYMLSIGFPFFFLLLLIPGKHAGCLLWFMMWIWIKSWDIGYAVVMMLDDVLFSIFALGSASVAELSLNPEFSVAMHALRSMDPTFHLSTYYAIVATAMSSVPVVTAHLVLGSLKGGAGLIAQGTNQISDYFSTGALEMDRQYRVTGDRLANQMAEAGAMASALQDANQNGGPGYRPPLSNPLGFGETGYGFQQEATRAWHENGQASPLYGSPDGTAGGYADRSATLKSIGTALRVATDTEDFGDQKGSGLSFFQGVGKAAGGWLESIGGNRFDFRDTELKATTGDWIGFHWANKFDPQGNPYTGGQNAATVGRLDGVMEIPTAKAGGHAAETGIESSRFGSQVNMLNASVSAGESFFNALTGIGNSFPSLKRGKATPSKGGDSGDGAGVGELVAGAALAGGAYALGLIGPTESHAGDIPPEIDRERRARAAGVGEAEVPVPMATDDKVAVPIPVEPNNDASAADEKGKAKANGQGNGGVMEEAGAVLETITAPIAALLGKDDKVEESEGVPPGLARPRGSAGGDAGSSSFDGAQVADIGASQVTTNGVGNESDTMGYEGVYQGRVNTASDDSASAAAESFYGTGVNVSSISLSSESGAAPMSEATETVSAFTPVESSSPSVDSSFGFGVSVDAKSDDQGAGWGAIAADDGGMAASWDTSGKRSSGSASRARSAGGAKRQRVQVVIHRPEEPTPVAAEEPVKKEEESSGAQIAFDPGMDLRGRGGRPLNDDTVLVASDAQALYNELRSSPVFFHGTSENLRLPIQNGGLNANTKGFSQEDVDFVSEMWAKANPDGGTLSFGRDTNPDRVILTGDRAMADAWAKSGSDAVAVTLEEIPKLQTSDALSADEKSNLSSIQSKYTDQMNNRSPLVVQVQGSVLDRLHPAQSSTTGVDYLRELIEKHDGPITKAEFIDTYIKNADIAVTSAQPFEIRLA